MAAGVKKKSGKSSGKKQTPIRSALSPESPLKNAVHDGLLGVKSFDRGYISQEIRSQFLDSVDIDEASRKGREGENRWDYLLGHGPSGQLIALEPHSANTAEVSVVIAKKKAATDYLRQHLVDGKKVASWNWVASGKVSFFPFDRAILALSRNGIAFVGRSLAGKHLP